MKYVVRYPPGGSGFFISALIHCVLSNSKFIPRSNGFAHHYNYAVFSTHNPTNLNQDLENFKKLLIYTDTEELFDRAEALQWFRNNFNNTNLHIINTHGININLFLESLDSPTKVFNVCITENDHNQICFNFLSKYIMLDPIKWFNAWGDFSCSRIKNNFPELKESDIFQKFRSAIFKKDIKFLHWYFRIYRHTYFKKYQIYTPNVQCHNIIWSDIVKEKFNIHDFLDFLEIEQTPLRRIIISDALRDYNSSQLKCPYNTKLNDYYSNLIKI